MCSPLAILLKEFFFPQQLFDKRCFVAGLQETRCKFDDVSSSVCGNFVCVSSASDKRSNYGCEVWLNASISFSAAFDDFVSIENIKVLYSEPRFLAASVVLRSCKFLAVSAHAPWLAGDPEKDKACLSWWRQFW
jgi:hypothetical protein